MTQQAQIPRPLPGPDHDSDPFWQGAKEHKLLIQKCSDCSTLRHPPQPGCPECTSLNSEWQEASGKGTVYSFVIQQQPTHPYFADVPYNVVLVELEEGTRLISMLDDVEPDQISIGLPVEVTFEDVNDEVTMPRFRPA